MIHISKLHVGILIVICTVDFIDASCLSYGHSCWGAHGKRSGYIPQREQNQETKSVEPNDRWGLFKIVPERNEIYRLKGIFQGNQQVQFPDDTTNSLNFPPIEQQISSSEEISPIGMKDINVERNPTLHDLEDFPQKQLSLRQRIPNIDNIKSFQALRINKPNFEK